MAKYLIGEAKRCGGDLVKFQLYDHNILYKNEPQIPDVSLSKEQAIDLFNHGKQVGIEVFFSVFDTERVKWCEEIGVERYKLSATCKNTDLISAVLTTDKPVIISRSSTVPPLRVYSRITYLYCVPNYPAEITRFHKIKWTEYDGLSDHTIGLDCAKIALARGANIIEKHFSLCYNMGIDGKWSMIPEDLKELKRWEQVVKQVL